MQTSYIIRVTAHKIPLSVDGDPLIKYDSLKERIQLATGPTGMLGMSQAIVSSKPDFVLYDTYPCTCRETIVSILNKIPPKMTLCAEAGIVSFVSIVIKDNADYGMDSLNALKAMSEKSKAYLIRVLKQVIGTRTLFLDVVDNAIKLVFCSKQTTSSVRVSAGLQILRLLSYFCSGEDLKYFNSLEISGKLIEMSREKILSGSESYGLRSDQILYLAVFLHNPEIANLRSLTYNNGPSNFVIFSYSADKWVDFLSLLGKDDLDLYENLSFKYPSTSNIRLAFLFLNQRSKKYVG